MGRFMAMINYCTVAAAAHRCRGRRRLILLAVLARSAAIAERARVGGDGLGCGFLLGRDRNRHGLGFYYGGRILPRLLFAADVAAFLVQQGADGVYRDRVHDGALVQAVEKLAELPAADDMQIAFSRAFDEPAGEGENGPECANGLQAF